MAPPGTKHFDRCCNPFAKKGHKITWGLRHPSDQILAKISSLSCREYLCNSCRKQCLTYKPIAATISNDDKESHTLVTPQSSELSKITQVSVPDLDNELPMINEAFRLLQQSPIPKKKVKLSKWTENKVDKVSASMKRILGVSEKPPTDPQVADDAASFREMISAMKIKFHDTTTSRSKKIEILTLLPPSWTNVKITREFGVSLSMVRFARKLVIEQGIMSSPNRKLGKRLHPATADTVKAFYESDEVSVNMPGMKDFVSMRDNQGGRYHRQKRLILCNLKELYQHFIEQNPQLRVGFSTFASLRPKYCVLAGASGTHTVCVCPMHQNLKLMILASNLPKLTEDLVHPLAHYEDCLATLICPEPSSNCYFGECDTCPGSQRLHDILLDALDEREIESISYKQWVAKPRTMLETQIKNSIDFADEFCLQATSLLSHSFVAKQQSKYLKFRKETLQEGEILVICDFAENYSFVVQNAAPGFHWNDNQVTVYPVVIYYNEGNEIRHRSLAIISDCLHHDTVAVHVFTRIIIDFAKSEIFTPTRVIYFSDGAPQQFKNYKNFMNLYYHEEDFGMLAEWHFFGTAHGKGPCDGNGGTLKRLAARASLQLPPDEQILTPQDLYNWTCLSNSLPSIKTEFSSIADYEVAKEFLRPRFENARSIPGTQKKHCFVPGTNGLMSSKIFSYATESDVHKIFKTGNSGH